MAVTALEAFEYPGFVVPYSNNRSITIGSTTIDAAGEYVGAVFQAPKTGNIAAIHVRSATVSVAGDGDVRLETVDATTGFPTNTLVAANTNFVRTFSTNNNWYRNVLTAVGPVTRGQRIAAVVRRSTGNYGLSNYDSGSYLASFPYGVLNTGSDSKSGAALNCLIEYDDTTYPQVFNLFGVTTATGSTINTGTTPDEVGLLFTAPLAFRTTGCVVHLDLDGTAEVLLYDTSNNIIAQATWLDPDLRSATGAGRFELYWDAEATLTAGAQYRLVVKPTTVTSVVVSCLDVNTAAYMSALSGGTDGHFTQRTDAGSWTQTTTKKPMFALIVNGIDVAAASGTVGGGNMSGGLQ